MIISDGDAVDECHVEMNQYISSVECTYDFTKK